MEARKLCAIGGQAFLQVHFAQSADCCLLTLRHVFFDGPQTRSNAVAWNPMEAFNFTVANEDCNLYTYDMRKLATASCLHKVRTHFRCNNTERSCLGRLVRISPGRCTEKGDAFSVLRCAISFFIAIRQG